MLIECTAHWRILNLQTNISNCLHTNAWHAVIAVVTTWVSEPDHVPTDVLSGGWGKDKSPTWPCLAFSLASTLVSAPMDSLGRMPPIVLLALFLTVTAYIWSEQLQKLCICVCAGTMGYNLVQFSSFLLMKKMQPLTNGTHWWALLKLLQLMNNTHCSRHFAHFAPPTHTWEGGT